MANHRTYTPKKGKQVLADIESGTGVAKAAKNAGVCRKTVYNWRDDYESFGEAFDDVQEGITDSIETTVIQKALAGDVTAGIFMLKSRRRSTYGEKQAIEHTGANGSPLTIVIEKPE